MKFIWVKYYSVDQGEDIVACYDCEVARYTNPNEVEIPERCIKKLYPYMSKWYHGRWRFWADRKRQ